MAKLKISDEWWSAPAESESGELIIVTGRRDMDNVIAYGKYKYRVEVSWHYGEGGMPDVPTSELMEKITDSLKAELKKDPVAILTGIYTGAGDGTPTIQLINYWKSRNSAAAAEAVDIWNGGEKGNNMAAHRMPMLNPTTEENSEQSTLFNAIDTYADEMYYKFIIGEESLDNFDQYVDTIRNMGIDRVLELKNTQYQRYLNR